MKKLPATRVHLGLASFWLLMAVPGLTIFKKSLLFVILMSLYANVEASLAAYQAAKDTASKSKRLRASQAHRQSRYYQPRR